MLEFVKAGAETGATHIRKIGSRSVFGTGVHFALNALSPIMTRPIVDFGAMKTPINGPGNAIGVLAVDAKPAKDNVGILHMVSQILLISKSACLHQTFEF